MTVSTGVYGIVQPLGYQPNQGDWDNWMDLLAQQLGNLQNYTAQAPVPLAVNGVYSQTFQSGYILYTGPGQTIASNTNFLFGLALPNPSGNPGVAVLLGSGGGSGTNVSSWIISDQAFDVNTPGNDLGITAGETQPGSSARGGNLLTIAGASDQGVGGTLTLQGGTSAGGQGGECILAGGNSTTGPAGDVFVIGGQNGIAGANVHLIATILNSIPGVIRHRFNSNIIFDEHSDGSWFLYNGGGFGLAGQALVSGGPGNPVSWLTGFTGTITTAALTSPGGTQGSMTFASGILISQVPAT